ncbi:hypothetical protein J3E69DRAFT_336074 [Trichoderma sp. SZMC 28015]
MRSSTWLDHRQHQLHLPLCQKPRRRQFGRIGHTASRVGTSIMHGRSRLQHSSRRVNRSQPMPMDPDPEAEFLHGIRLGALFFLLSTPLACPTALRRRTPGLSEGRVSRPADKTWRSITDVIQIPEYLLSDPAALFFNACPPLSCTQTSQSKTRPLSSPEMAC